MEPCIKCNEYLAEYEVPSPWCRFCWVNWWFEIPNAEDNGPIAHDEQEKQDYLKELEASEGPAVRFNHEHRSKKSSMV